MRKRKYTIFLSLLLSILIVNVSNLKAQLTDTVRVEAPAAEPNEVYTTDEGTTEDEFDVKDTILSVVQWNYPADSLQKIKKQKEFSYISNLDSLLKAKQEEELKKELKTESAPLRNPSAVFFFIRLLLWIIAIFTVLFVIYRLFLSEKGMFASPAKNKKLQLVEEVITDDLFFETRLREATLKADYRLAIRFLYLQTLHKLSEKGWLQLSTDKTNYQYVKELKNHQLKNEFARVTLHYEYAWYGDFKIEEGIFIAVHQEFIQFTKKIKQV